MTALSYSASPGGHYAEVTVSPGATDVFALYAGSYNGYDILPAYLAVSNTNNALPVTITFGDGSTAIVPPFTSSAIVCAGRRQARLTNNGGQAIIITVFDAGHAKLYLDQYNSQPWQVPGSDNQIILHFTENPILNYGSGTKTITQLASNATVVTTGGKFDGGYLTNIAPGVANTGLYIEIEELIDFTGAFTYDFWFRRGVTATAGGYDIFGFVSPSGLISSWIGWKGRTAGAFQVNGEAITAALITNDDWHHLAFVAPGTGGGRFYVDGIQRSVSASAIPARDVQNGIYLRNNCDGDISELRFRLGAQWITNFTPPTEPYT